ncbi:RAB21 [Symbiodinium sp. CCMP2456]|nr:RAB21 [Symbiodinium sp. CCMP2456]
MSQEGPFKIVILGEGRVGKTSLLRQFVSKTFSEHEASTQSAAYLDKILQLRGTQVQLSLWDTAGQERFHSLAPIYYRNADGALLVYDITDLDSFRRVAKWVEELQVMGTKCVLAIVGNKSDLQSQAKVPKADAETYARSINARHSTASAKLGFGVDEAFGALAEDVLASKARAPSQNQTSSRRTRGALVVEEDVPRPRQKSGCCGGPSDEEAKSAVRLSSNCHACRG